MMVSSHSAQKPKTLCLYCSLFLYEVGGYIKTGRPIEKKEPFPYWLSSLIKAICMKRCEECRAKNDLDANYCKKCGNKLSSSIGKTKAGEEAPEKDDERDSKAKDTDKPDVGKLRREQDISKLNKCLTHSSKEVRFEAADALGDLAWYKGVAKKSSIPRLNKLLEDSDEDVRMSAVLALGQLAEAGVAHESSIPKLNKALEDEDVRVREFAVDALSSLAESGVADESSLPKLDEVLQDTHEEVRGFAENTIKKLKETLRG